MWAMIEKLRILSIECVEKRPSRAHLPGAKRFRQGQRA
jgi:hypothetical protein